MKYAADFRKIAREALAGRWSIALLAGLIASLLGAIEIGGSTVNVEIDFDSLSKNPLLTERFDPNELAAILSTLATFLLVASCIGLVIYIILFFIGSVVGLGYSKFNLELVDGENDPEISTLFSFFKRWKTAVLANLMKAVFIFLWALLFIIPGIIASYSYAMTSYLLAENPDMTASEAIDKSKQIMKGNRWRLFCLQLSFIGWDFLCVFTLGIGNLWLTPYKQASVAAFFRDVSKSAYTAEEELQGWQKELPDWDDAPSASKEDH